jgi:hypothetical protein
MYIEHEETNLKANEAETKEILKAAEELERNRVIMGVESVKGIETDPVIARARADYAWCAERYLPPSYLRGGSSLESQLKWVDDCFKTMPGRCGSC